MPSSTSDRLATAAAVAQSPDYRFARAPRWVVSHVLVVALVAAMITAGFWQIDRHRARAERNDLISARAELAPVELASVVAPDAPTSVGDDEQYRRVVVTGTFQIDDEVLVRNRSLDGAPGWWVLTPLLTDDGWAVAVNRGWIPLFYDDDQPRPGTEPPTGVVTISGSIQPSRTAEGFQVADPSEGRLSSLARPDVERLAAQVDYPLLPVVVRVEPAAAAAADALPVPLPAPPVDGGPHLSYAAQWFIFTTIALVGYPLVLRRVARGQGRSAPMDERARPRREDKEAEASRPRR